MNKITCQYKKEPCKYPIKFMCLKTHKVVNRDDCKECQKESEE